MHYISVYESDFIGFATDFQQCVLECGSEVYQSISVVNIKDLTTVCDCTGAIQ